MDDCPDNDAIAALLAGALAHEEHAAILAHLDACEACHDLVADAARAGPGPEVERSPGASLGRYVVLETVGAGAMGVVYAAYDPELDRKVALKVLRSAPSATGDPSTSGSAQRLVREAHALAKLAHPNVITVHDAGTIGAEVFIAMEFVATGTLGDWLTARPPPRDAREVLRTLRQAGEGLAAAHEAGLEHRDFKPENVLVGVDGRARVTDFGLARGVDREGAAIVNDRDEPATIDVTLTRTGALVGTPAYMAPERLRGERGDARSDQFSFCVTAYEALYGERPFGGADLASLAAATEAGRVRRQPAGSRVPTWLRRTLVRGLEADPERRFPTMRALLDELDAGSRAGARPLVIGGLLVVLGLAAVAVGSAWRAAARPVCTGGARAWGDAWDAEGAGRVRAAFSRSSKASAGFALGEVVRVLDAYRDDWIAMHQDTCEATRVRGEQSELLLDLRMRCLDDRRRQVVALSHLLEGADDAVVDRSVSAALSLPSLRDCTNATALSAKAPPPDQAVRATVDAVGDELARANALDYAGQYAHGLEVARPALERARATHYTPLVAKALYASGKLTYDANDHKGAEPLLHEAAAAALDAREELVAADAWTALVRLVGTNGGRSDDARAYAAYAEAAIRRAGGDDEREATRLRFLATVLWRREHKLDEARGLVERARTLFAASHGARYDFQVASCDEGIAGIEFDRGHPELALPLHERVVAVRERLFGGDHPSVAIALVNLGEDLTKLGRAGEAIPLLRRSVALSAPRAAKGGDAYVRHRLAAALRAAQQPAAALEEDRASHDASARAGETDGYWESFPLTGIGLDLLLLGRPREALAPLERAVALRATNPVAFEVAEARFALAHALFAGDATSRARAVATAKQAREDLSPDADRYGGVFATSRREMDEWLARAGATP